jgi:predicted Zn finger-like uncharacterized protein
MPATACPHCRKIFRVPPDQLGKKFRCASCLQVFVTALYSAPAVPPPVPPAERAAPTAALPDEDEVIRPRLGRNAVGLLCGLLGLLVGGLAGGLAGYAVGANGGKLSAASAKAASPSNNPAAEERAPAAISDWRAPVRQGDFILTVRKVETGYPLVIEPQSDHLGRAVREKRLCITLRVVRADGQPFSRSRWPEASYRLTDDEGLTYRTAYPPAGYYFKEDGDWQLGARSSVPASDEFLVFSAENLKRDGFLFLEVGVYGENVRFQIPAKAVAR